MNTSTIGRWRTIQLQDQRTGSVKATQTFPLDDLVEHIMDEFCFCLPVVKRLGVDGIFHISHNSFDGREKVEANREDN